MITKTFDDYVEIYNACAEKNGGCDSCARLRSCLKGWDESIVNIKDPEDELDERRD